MVIYQLIVLTCQWATGEEASASARCQDQQPGCSPPKAQKLRRPDPSLSWSQAHPRIKSFKLEPAPRNQPRPRPTSPLPLHRFQPPTSVISEGKFALPLLKYPQHPAGILYQKGLYPVIRTWWTLYVSVRNIRDVAIHPPCNCSFMEKNVVIVEKTCIHYMPISQTISLRKIRSEMDRNLICFAVANSRPSGRIYASDLQSS